MQGPAALVHGDYTAASAPRRLAGLGGALKVNDPLKAKLGDTPLVPAELVKNALEQGRRFVFLNVWRPLSTYSS